MLMRKETKSRPFLATARDIIDVSEGKLMLRVGDEEAVFKILNITKKSLDCDSACYYVDITHLVVIDHLHDIVSSNPLEKCLEKSTLIDDCNPLWLSMWCI
ncbi:hypothetical protein L6164_002010 [Bauhinia variegata]|uniref:Uncharacterized protein n=1 Tax=Bauhinia variegata TaxID=167791 RepID=A0ACB9PWQ9_BAUVA|nr:hypothetical protein L6164_002010 [Bauhinia variegata]